MRISPLPVALLVLASCVQSRERAPDSLRAKIDTSSGLLAVDAGRVDSNPASTAPRTPPLIGGDSNVTHGSTDFAVQQAARSDSGTIENPSDRALLRAELRVPVSGVSPAMLHDTYDELRGGTRPHQALDILAARGTPVISAADGRVLRLFNSKAGGLMVYAADPTEHYILMYGHLDAYQPGLVDGQRLQRGQTIGFVGTTGNAPPNVPHLHFAIARTDSISQWWKGTPVNPYPLLAP